MLFDFIFVNAVQHPYILACVTFIVMEITLYIFRQDKYIAAQESLIRAKQETQEIAQLPRNNPHPQFQISHTGKLIFANPATLDIFPDLEQKGLSHAILVNIKNKTSREITFNTNTYLQNIIETQVDSDTAYIVYCHDITQRKASEQAVIEAHKKADEQRKIAEAATEARGEFLANMSHELRTPMNGIIGISDMIAENGLDAENQPLIEAVNSSAKNLLFLLNDILDFSKIEAGELTIEHIVFDMHQTIQQIESLQRPIASQKGLLMHFQILDNVPQFVMGDPARICQILNNLIGNAIKFTKQGSVTITVSAVKTSNKNSTINIDVSDTGIGIAADKQATIFQKFQQADTSTSRQYGGTGLGLSISQNLTQLMNGQISVESQENIGTTFTVSIPFPITNKPLDTNQNNPVTTQSGINTAARLMIVDDHPVNLLFLKKSLERMGFHNIDVANNGQQALNQHNTSPYDLIIMDCQMPDMDGFQASQKIRQGKNSKQPIIIAATADAMKGARDKCLAADMNDYISKPIDRNELQTLLRQWLPRTDNHEDTPPLNITQSLSNYENNDIINWNHLNQFTNGDTEMERQAVEIFIENLHIDIAALNHSIACDDYKSWNASVHKIYGACAQIGAHSLAAICDQGQTLSHGKAKEIHSNHQEIFNEYRRVIDYFNSLSM